MVNASQIERFGDVSKIQDFTIKNNLFLDKKLPPVILIKTKKGDSKINQILDNMAIPFGLQVNHHKSDSDNSHKNYNSDSVLEEFDEMSYSPLPHKNTEDSVVIEKSLFDKLLGIVDEIDKTRKRQSTRRIKNSKKKQTKKLKK